MTFTTFANGTVANADEVNANFNSISPVGAVIAWLKSYTNTPTLPDEWVECNGQTLDDAESVYDGQTMPDLNGDNRFLRGNATSSGTGGTESHTHTWRYDTTSSKGSSSGEINSASNLPPYYNVVWIMRIK